MINLKRFFHFNSFILLIFINCFLIVECDLNDKQSVPWEFTLNRSGCRGSCPVYSFQINNNGIMKYDGVSYVKTDSSLTIHFGDKQVTQLEDLFKAYDYFSFDSSYSRYIVTDLSWITTSLKYGDRYKKVIHYLGDSEAPAQISHFEIAVEELLETMNLTGIEPADHYHDFNFK